VKVHSSHELSSTQVGVTSAIALSSSDPKSTYLDLNGDVLVTEDVLYTVTGFVAH
jgi:hypothetical protein